MTTKNQNVLTARDYDALDAAREFKQEQERLSFEKKEIAEVNKKIAYWTKKVELFGGEVQKQTLAKFQAKLTWLVG